MKNFFWALATLGMFSSPDVLAQWYTAYGSAAIVNTADEARKEAINDALRNILLQSGADISFTQEFNNGIMVSENLKFQSQNPVRKVQVISEQKTSKTVTVSIKAWLDEKTIPKKCSGSELKKSLLPLGFKFVDLNAKQGSVGIDHISTALNQLIYDQKTLSSGFMLKPLSKANLGLDNYSNSPLKAQRNNIISLGKQNEAQYIISGTINSVSLSQVGDNPFTKMLYTPTRSLNFDVTVYDALKGSVIYQKNYLAEADWPFSQGEFVDLRSDRFLGSSYGQRLKELCKEATNDIILQLECIKPSARVIDVDGDEFIINLGSEAGLKKGSVFNLNKTATIYSGRNSYNMQIPSPGRYKVIAVYPHAATLKPADIENNTIMIEIDDLVTLE